MPNSLLDQAKFQFRCEQLYFLLYKIFLKYIMIMINEYIEIFVGVIYFVFILN